MTEWTWAAAAVAGMAVVTYGTRAGGLVLMSFARSTPRTERVLRHLSTSVLVALVVPAALRGGARAVVATAVAAGVALVTRNLLAAMLAGAAIAAAVRWFVPGL